MTKTRIDASKETMPYSKYQLELSQYARQGKVFGVAFCNMDPSGCYDVIQGLSEALYDFSYVRVQSKLPTIQQNTDPHEIDSTQYLSYLDTPTENSSCEALIFTGCEAQYDHMDHIVYSLCYTYHFSQIQCIYYIATPDHSCPEYLSYHENQFKINRQAFSLGALEYRFLTTGIDGASSSNIGIPRLKLASSQFLVPQTCYGMIDHQAANIHLLWDEHKHSNDIKCYFKEYFYQVSLAAKECTTKPIIVIALSVKNPEERKKIVEIARSFSIEIDFCDAYEGRLSQEDFIHLLSVIKTRGGIVSFDDRNIQSVIKASSLNTPFMVYSTETNVVFYKHILELLPEECKETAQVILGLNHRFDLLKDKKKCQIVYTALHLVIDKAHQKFEGFKISVAEEKRSRQGQASNNQKIKCTTFLNCTNNLDIKLMMLLYLGSGMIALLTNSRAALGAWGGSLLFLGGRLFSKHCQRRDESQNTLLESGSRTVKYNSI